MRIIKHNGYEICPVDYQGCRSYMVPDLGKELASSLKVAKRWIDEAIASRELPKRPAFWVFGKDIYHNERLVGRVNSRGQACLNRAGIQLVTKLTSK